MNRQTRRAKRAQQRPQPKRMPFFDSVSAAANVGDRMKEIESMTEWTEEQRAIAGLDAFVRGWETNAFNPNSSPELSGLRRLLTQYATHESNGQVEARKVIYGMLMDKAIDLLTSPDRQPGSPRVDSYQLPHSSIVLHRQISAVSRVFEALEHTWKLIDQTKDSYEEKVWFCASVMAKAFVDEGDREPQLRSYGQELSVYTVMWDEHRDKASFGRMINVFLDIWSMCNGLVPGGMMDLTLAGTNLNLVRDPTVTARLPDSFILDNKRYTRAVQTAFKDVVREPVDEAYKARIGAAQKVLWDDFHKWAAQPTLVLQKNDCSRVHNLIEAVREYHCHVLSTESNDLRMEQCDRTMEDVVLRHEVMVVRHDWARAIGQGVKEAGAEAAGSMQMPFPHMLFEFRISDRNVMAMVSTVGEDLAATGAETGRQQIERARLQFGGMVADSGAESGELLVSMFYQCPVNGHWLAMSPRNDLLAFLVDQVSCICVALDAEVASRSVIRAPTALNAKRSKTGKPTMRDYHVVDLAKRSQVNPPPPPRDPTAPHRRSPRLHFRRGHWRHYATHKTRIKWQLVGNPDLGFIEHEYRL